MGAAGIDDPYAGSAIFLTIQPLPGKKILCLLAFSISAGMGSTHHTKNRFFSNTLSPSA